MEESAHPSRFHPSPPMPAASHTLTDTKEVELPLESVGLRTRQQSQPSSDAATEPLTVAAIGDLAAGIKIKRVASSRKVNKGATKKVATTKGANKKGARNVVSKNNPPNVHPPMYISNLHRMTFSLTCTS
jgi:hypothetical protein